MVEIRKVTKAGVQSDVQHCRGCGSESQGRLTQPSSQKELVRREADDLPEGSQEMKWTDSDERAQVLKTQRLPETQLNKPNRRGDSTFIPNAIGSLRSPWRLRVSHLS